MSLKKANILLINQIQEFLSMVSDEMYVRPMTQCDALSIGEFVCEIYSTYSSLINQVDSNRIDYLNEEKEALIALSPIYAIESFTLLSADLFDLIELDSLEVSTDKNANSSIQSHAVSSSSGRELLFLIQNTQQQLLLLKWAIKLHFPVFNLPISFAKLSSHSSILNLK